ncbi:hypothetical protein Q9L58_004485 [Maublancomyces gigas]|uniref:CFEM domain-containing protein n=1 Tax=Discina gigas TaxID=1032678 RepID=A0ABR3GKS8_9PEZI
MSLSIRRVTSSLLVLLAVSCLVQLATALPGGLRTRQEVELPGFLGFVPSCARQCVTAGVISKGCVGDGVESCLCGGDPQGFRDSVWQCIDGNCGGRDSDFHQAAVVSVEGLCEAPISTDTQSAVTTSTQSSSRSFRSTTTASSPVLPSVTETSFTSGTVPTATITTAATAAGLEKDDAAENGKGRTGLSVQTIIGISVGSFCLLAAVVGAFVYCAMTRRRKNHRTQIQSMTLEPHSPRGGAAVVWMSINSTSNATIAGSYYSSDRRVPPIDTNVANQKLNAHRSGNISPVSPVSPIIQGFEFGEAMRQDGVIESRKTIENPQFFMAPAVIYTSASPIGTVDRMSSPMPPVHATYRIRPTSDFSIHSYDGDLPGVAISTDFPEVSSSPLNHSSTNRHTSSTITTISQPNPLIPSSPPPEYAPSPVSESSGGAGSFVISHGPPPARISRSDTLLWRRELNQAASRAVTRVLHSEQSVNEEIDAAKRRKGSIPGLERFSKRLSRDNRADEESGLVGGERSSGFWSTFGSKSSRSSRSRGSPPQNPSFMGKRSNSGVSQG